MNYKYFDDNKLYDLVFQDDFEKVKDFLERYGLDSRDRDGATFLMTCIVEDEYNFVVNLLELGTNVNAQQKSGYSALHFAIQESNLPILNLLLGVNEIDLNLQDKYGHTPLLRILTNGNRKDPRSYMMVEKLINRGASLEIENSSGQSPRSMMEEITKERIIDSEGNLVDYSHFL